MREWSAEESDTATRLWREGQSAAQIAKALSSGRSRNSVIGRIHRLGLTGRVYMKAVKKAARRKPSEHLSQNKIKGAHIAAAKPAQIEALPVSLNVPFLAREPRQCKAVTDNTRHEQRCCGAPRVSGSPWCADHKRLYTVPLTPAQRARSRRLASLVRYLDSRGAYKITTYGPGA